MTAGTALRTAAPKRPESELKDADLAMRRAKALGGSRREVLVKRCTRERSAGCGSKWTADRHGGTAIPSFLSAGRVIRRPAYREL
jgi:hypothetical protein